jgi:uncharacterized protein with HEPN domain
MMRGTDVKSRLQFLARVVTGEQVNLSKTDQKLFIEPFSAERAVILDQDEQLAERVDAFVARFSRLQDTLGDKLLPALLTVLGESRPTLVDRLDMAEKLGWISSSEEWMAIRSLRNQMIHEYIEDPKTLAEALQSGHDYVPELSQAARKMLSELETRGWLEPGT